MAQYGFGTGSLFGLRTDAPNATPIQFGALQDVSIDVSFNVKELHGQYQYPLAVARSTAKVTGKAKHARIDGRVFNDLFFGQTLSATEKTVSLNEAAVVAASSPYTATVAHAADFVDDLGVVYAASGLPLTKVASVTAAGQYSVASGVYTFHSTDSGVAVTITYSYNLSGTVPGHQLLISNQLLGSAPVFRIVCYETYQGNPFEMELMQCISTKLQIPTKVEDFIQLELDFQAFADPAGNVMRFNFAE